MIEDSQMHMKGQPLDQMHVLLYFSIDIQRCAGEGNR